MQHIGLILISIIVLLSLIFGFLHENFFLLGFSIVIAFVGYILDRHVRLSWEKQ